MADQQENVKGGPANHAAHTDLDAPTPPGGPQRQDRPTGDLGVPRDDSDPPGDASDEPG